MFIRNEEEFIELKLDIKDTLEKVKNDLKYINISLKDINAFETILEIDEELLGISFNLAITNACAKNKDFIIKSIIRNVMNKIEKMYIKENE